MGFNAVVSIVGQDFEAVNELIRKKLESNVPFINELGDYIVSGGGKRIRPLLCLLSAKACGYQGVDHILVAAINEFLHTATLLHDDVVDRSDLRRGRATINAKWGNAAAVLVGDFLVSRSFQMIVETKSFELMKIIADATNYMSEGEVLQLLSLHDPGVTEERYLTVIRYKTGKLFEVAAESGAIIAQQSQFRAALRAYAQHIGAAFQLIDDLLDYSSSSDDLGKNIGDDLAEGKPTLPLIHALEKANEEEKAIIFLAIKEGGLENLEKVVEIVHSTSALEYVRKKAIVESELAIAAIKNLSDSPYKKALENLAQLVVSRQA